MAEAIISRMGGGGSGGLNFKVVGYATKAELLADTPKENTIGIITTNKITGWMLTPGDIEGNKQSANLYTTTSATKGAYLDDDGSEVSNNTYLITKYIQLPDNTKSLTATFPYTDEDVIAFYNSDKTFISTVQYEEGLATYSVPDGTRYIRVSYHVDKEPPTIYANYVVAQDFAEGTVLIQTGTESRVGFNALKKNGIQVYPLSAKQYVSGALVDVTAMSYQGGEWVVWITYIAINKNDWYKRNPYSGVSYSYGTYEFSGNSLKGKVTGGNQQVSLVKKEKVDFSAISKVKFVYSLDTNLSSSGQILVVVSKKNNDAGSNSSICEKLIFDKATKQTANLDVSGVSGQYYLWIGLACWENLGTVNFEISNLEFA